MSAFRLRHLIAVLAILAAVPALRPAASAHAATSRVLTVRQDGHGMFRTIQQAAVAARPGDTVLISGGTYRETVDLPTKDTSEAQPITFQAAPGQHPIITGADIQTDWHQQPDGSWQLVEPNSFFGSFNPFAMLWASGTLPGTTTPRSCGGVFVGDKVLTEVVSPAIVTSTPDSWTATVDASATTITANFGGLDPRTSDTEITHRKQDFTAAWNQAYINVEGLTIIRGTAPKDINYWRHNALPVAGALSVNGGYHWTINDDTFSQNLGVALDFGMGSQGVVDQHGGLPLHYGHHLLLDNAFVDNATNGAFAWKGPFTTVSRNRFVDNNAYNTRLVSEAYFKIVDEGPGVVVTDNYFYSDQDWPTLAIWLDTEVQDSRVSRNVLVNTNGVTYEADLANNRFDHNVILDQPMPNINAGTTMPLPRRGFDILEASGTQVDSNLFLGTANSTIENAHLSSGENFDGVARRAVEYRPGTQDQVGLRRVRIENNAVEHNFFYSASMTPIQFTEPVTHNEGDVDSGALASYLANRFWNNVVDDNVYADGAQPINDFTAGPSVPDAHSVIVPFVTAPTFTCTPSTCRLDAAGSTVRLWPRPQPIGNLLEGPLATTTVAPQSLLLAAGQAAQAMLTNTNTSSHTLTVNWHAAPPSGSGLTITPAAGSTSLTAGATARTRLSISNTSTTPGTVAVPVQVQATAGSTTGPITVTYLHITVPYPSLAAAFNNTGISDDANPAAANFGGGGGSWSAQALAAAGITPGATVSSPDGLRYTWPDVAVVTPDDVSTSGQVITLPGSGSTLGFLGAAAFGTHTGAVTVTYTDGSTSTDTITFSDWVAAAAPPGGVLVATLPYHNIPSGQSNQKVGLYSSTIPLDPAKTVAFITLPTDTDLHIFATAFG